MSARRGSRFVRDGTLSGDTTLIRDLVTHPSGVTIHAATGIMSGLPGVTAARIISQTTAELKALRFTNSGATFMPSGITLPAFDWGQGVKYKTHRGVHSLVSGQKVAVYNSLGGTTLSDGTIQFLTGLTTINNLVWSIQSDSVTPGDHLGYPEMIHWRTGYTNSNGGVTMTLWCTADGITYSACTPGNSRTGNYSGLTINWAATGS